VEDVISPLRSGAAHAVFLAIGAATAKHVDIPARHAAQVLDAIRLLHDVAAGEELPKLGRRVAIYGGGNTAMDAARVATRLGADETVIIYRRDRAHAPAHPQEIQEALDEGVVIQWLRTIREMDGGKLRVEVMRLDEHGAPVPTGEFETLHADTLILAVGQNPQSDWIRRIEGVSVSTDGAILVDEHMMTGHPGVFAGGDMVPAARTIATAVGHGKRAARNIDACLRGDTYVRPPRPPVANVERLNTWYYADAPASVQPLLDRLRRVNSFEEAAGGLTADTALYEARRCMSCGNCFGCDNCYGVCPDNAIKKLGPGQFQINLDYCKGCGMCVTECPCGCVEMVPELP
jgi:NADPH-dependent glutamate synthase beta subunit-like oxidoreductase